MPKVSVIIPAYNVEAFIRPCMDGVLAQTMKDIEVICVDDGSTDGTPAILREYGRKDPRVKILTQENGGAGKARNTGLAAARGETLSFLDADDLFEPDMLETAYRRLKETKAQFTVFDSDMYMNDTQEYRSARHIRTEALPPYAPFHRRAMTDNPFRVFIGWAWDKLYDASFVRENGLTFQEQRTTNDMAFVFSAIAIGERISVTAGKKLAHHRKNVNSSLSNTREASWHCFHDALIRVKEFLVSRGIWHELEQDYVNYCLHAVLWNLGSLQGEAKEKLFLKLKADWLEEFGLTDRPESYFDSKGDYQQLRNMLALDFVEYCGK